MIFSPPVQIDGGRSDDHPDHCRQSADNGSPAVAENDHRPSPEMITGRVGR
ncbi:MULTISPECIES: hypothetical protein [unclassified Blastococcus]|uniref:hypothetical protein n=1 Tax=unclassified Blastococcus TaxID=2619396 RepID=UPI001EF04EC3|nr:MULTISPECIES: hypothetical protein [unclassified Blastococcus]